jgi:hypothetical protein
MKLGVSLLKRLYSALKYSVLSEDSVTKYGSRAPCVLNYDIIYT